MKDQNTIIQEGLIARIRELERETEQLRQVMAKLNVRSYLLSQFVFDCRNELLNDFAEFCLDNCDECADNYGYENAQAEAEVLEMLKDLADGINEGDSRDYSEFERYFVIVKYISSDAANSLANK